MNPLCALLVLLAVAVNVTPADDPLYTQPEVVDALRGAWQQAKLGYADTEAGFYYTADGKVVCIPCTNEAGHLTFNLPSGAKAVFHTHPNALDGMSSSDIDAANKHNVDMYLLNRDGLYYYRPGMRKPELVVKGLSFLSK